MLGALFGDLVGSVYEFHNTSDIHFPLFSKGSSFTDDSYMTLAVAKALIETKEKSDAEIQQACIENMQEFGRRYPHAGYGGMFLHWLCSSKPKPYNSFGNGSAMRVSAAGWLYPTLAETLHAAELTASVTHNHPEGIKGAKAIAACIFLARNGCSKEKIKAFAETEFQYDLSRRLDDIRPGYSFYEICQKSVPEAIISFLEGNHFEDVIRKAVTLGGDSDTIACMAGSIAEAYYGMPAAFREEVLNRLTPDLKAITAQFLSVRL